MLLQGRCPYTFSPPDFCCAEAGLRCATERLIYVARGVSPRRAIELLLIAAARLCLRGERPVSALVNGCTNAISRARTLEELP